MTAFRRLRARLCWLLGHEWKRVDCVCGDSWLECCCGKSMDVDGDGNGDVLRAHGWL